MDMQSSPPSIRVLIAEDHAALRKWLRAVVASQTDMQVVGEAETAAGAIAITEALQPDLVSLDLNLPDGSSVAAIEQIRLLSPGTKVLVLTTEEDPAYFRAVMAAGASGYLLKTASEGELLMAYRAVAQGRIFCDLPAVGAGSWPLERCVRVSCDALSPREREVLQLIAHGNTNQEAADLLLLSVKTVETYRARIVEKLGLRKRTDLVRYALQAGLLSPSESVRVENVVSSS